MNIELLSEYLNLDVLSIRPVGGGDINSSYCVESIGCKYFIKINDSGKYPKLFERESEGLKELSVSKYIYVPRVIKTGVFENYQYLLLNWIEKETDRTVNFNEYLAKGLVEIHKTSSNFFGWKNDNYIGTLIQKNNHHNNWSDFYYYERLLPLIIQVTEKNQLNPKYIKELEKIHKELNAVFPKENPSLLHGDLWNGNVMKGNKGLPFLYDPAVYYGHREMDIGMMTLFGGFDKAFYKLYNELFPLGKGWENRIELTQLYPMLVHACLFGGRYINTCLDTINKFGK